MPDDATGQRGARRDEDRLNGLNNGDARQFPDTVGRELMELKSFRDSLKHAEPGKLVIEIPPAPLVEPVAETAVAGKGKTGPKGKGAKAAPEDDEDPVEPTAVSDLKLGEAIKVIRTLTVAGQIEEIYNKDPRSEVKEECQKRLDKLIEEAKLEASKKAE